jgi:hypothetical protein
MVSRAIQVTADRQPIQSPMTIASSPSRAEADLCVATKRRDALSRVRRPRDGEFASARLADRRREAM